MNIREVKRQLAEAYPGANIVPTTRRRGRITELVAELGISPDGQSSTAMAVIDRASEHYHRVTTERYVIERGTLRVHIDGKQHELREGQEITITPGKRHFAEGNAAWVRVVSTPPWTPDDFYKD